jgi:hypothetical protein
VSERLPWPSWLAAQNGTSVALARSTRDAELAFGNRTRQSRSVVRHQVPPELAWYSVSPSAFATALRGHLCDAFQNPWPRALAGTGLETRNGPSPTSNKPSSKCARDELADTSPPRNASLIHF